MNMNVTLFDSFSPDAKITLISQAQCPKESLLFCSVPNVAYSHVDNCTYALLLSKEPIFVRSVNSCFYEVEIDEEKYYVHEQYIRKEK